LADGRISSSKAGGAIEIGVSMLPKLPRDAGDRNRTSPFAFTGNKFEFRAVGSSQSIAGPNTILNAIVAESLDHVATKLEKAVAGGMDLNAAVQALMPELVKEFKASLFDGDNYTAEWHAEAARRGLPNYRNTVDAVPLATSPQVVAMLGRYGVYSERELHSRQEILLENYARAVIIEGKTASMMVHTMIVPAALRYQADVAGSINALAAAGVASGAQKALLSDLAATIDAARKGVLVLDAAIEAAPHGDAFEAATQGRDRILVSMQALRAHVDKLETMVDDTCWPLPTYHEMLFIR
jgi:glutamine synthetase